MKLLAALGLYVVISAAARLLVLILAALEDWFGWPATALVAVAAVALWGASRPAGGEGE